MSSFNLLPEDGERSGQPRQRRGRIQARSSPLFPRTGRPRLKCDCAGRTRAYSQAAAEAPIADEGSLLAAGSLPERFKRTSIGARAASDALHLVVARDVGRLGDGVVVVEPLQAVERPTAARTARTDETDATATPAVREVNQPEPVRVLEELECVFE